MTIKTKLNFVLSCLIIFFSLLFINSLIQFLYFSKNFDSTITTKVHEEYVYIFQYQK